LNIKCKFVWVNRLFRTPWLWNRMPANFSIMEKETHEQYEYARRRIRQKKNLYFHFVLLAIGSLFLFVSNVLMHVGAPEIWYIWAVAGWLFLFILHFIKVFITDRFMNKNWERDQIERLITRQQNRIEQLHLKAEDHLSKKL
jgi:2TM domain-containing protein